MVRLAAACTGTNEGPGASPARVRETAAARSRDAWGPVSEAGLRRVDTGERLLVSRGFHWVNERPFNR